MELCGTAGEPGVQPVGCPWGSWQGPGRSASDHCPMSYPSLEMHGEQAGRGGVKAQGQPFHGRSQQLR